MSNVWLLSVRKKQIIFEKYPIPRPKKPVGKKVKKR